MPASSSIPKQEAAAEANAQRVRAWAVAGADARLFVAAVESGSLAGAAARHGLTAAAVGKAIGRLEAALAVRLLERAPGVAHPSSAPATLQPSDEGRAFHERCARAFALLDAPPGDAAAHGGPVTGTVRLGLPTLIGSLLVAPRLPALLRRHPGLRVDLVQTMRLGDLVDRGLDLMIAVGPLPDATLVARPIGYGRFVTVAAPAYLRDAQAPRLPDELAAHRCLAFTGPDGRQPPWRFTIDGEPWTLAVAAVARSDDMHHLAAMACAGVGIAQLPLFAVADALDDGRLVPLLAAFEPPPRLASFVYPSTTLPRRARVLVEHLLAEELRLPAAAPADAAPALDGAR